MLFSPPAFSIGSFINFTLCFSSCSVLYKYYTALCNLGLVRVANWKQTAVSNNTELLSGFVNKKNETAEDRLHVAAWIFNLASSFSEVLLSTHPCNLHFALY